MSVTVLQKPGELDINVSDKDDLNFVVTFKKKTEGSAIDLTSYTFEAYIEWSNGSQKINANKYSAVDGQVEIEITKAQLAKVPKTGDKTWYLKWTVASKSRKVLSGRFII